MPDFSSDITMGLNRVTGLNDPSASLHAVNKQYADKLPGRVLGIAQLGTSLAAPAFSTTAAAVAGLSVPISATDITAVLAYGHELCVEARIPWFQMGTTGTYIVLYLYEDGAPRTSEAFNMVASTFATVGVSDTFVPTSGAHSYTVYAALGTTSTSNNVYVQLPPNATPAVPYLKVSIA